MQSSSNRVVVIISALLTLLVLGGATLAIAFRNGWLHAGAPSPSPNAVTAEAQLADAERSRTPQTAREVNPSPALNPSADQREVAAYRERLAEAYRALDDAYSQIRSLQTAQAQVASRGEGDRRFTEHDDDDHRERGSRRRSSDDN